MTVLKAFAGAVGLTAAATLFCVCKFRQELAAEAKRNGDLWECGAGGGYGWRPGAGIGRAHCWANATGLWPDSRYHRCRKYYICKTLSPI